MDQNQMIEALEKRVARLEALLKMQKKCHLISLAQIRDAVCSALAVSVLDLSSHCRDARFVEARKLFSYLATLQRYSSAEIARFLRPDMDRSMVSHHLHKAKFDLEHDEHFKRRARSVAEFLRINIARPQVRKLQLLKA